MQSNDKEFLKSSLRDHEFLHRKIDQVVEQIELGYIKVGDILYCCKALKDVVILELPKHEDFEFYYQAKSEHRYAPFPGHIKYKAIKGLIGEAPIACFTIIKKGNFSEEFSIKKKDIEIEGDIIELEDNIRSNGFRLEKNENQDEFIYKIFGDSQEEVDEFIIALRDGFIFDF